MKKNFMWTMAALFVSGLAFTACQVEDNPNPDPLAEFTPSAIDFEDEDVSMFTIADPARMTVSVVDDEATGSKVASFTRSNSSSRGFAYYNFASRTENATAVTVSFDFQVKAAILAPSAITVGDANVHNATYGINEGQYGYTSNGAIFNIGATRGKINGSNTNYFWINDQPAAVDNDSYEIKAADIWGQWLHVDLDINVANREYTYVVKKGNDVLFSSGDAPIAFLSDNAATCTQIDIASGNTGTYLLDNISVQKQGKDENIKYADYTVKFVDVAGWGQVNIHAWNNDGASTSWPGVPGELAGTINVFGVEADVYTCTVSLPSAPAFLIFNNGNGTQSEGDSFVEGATYSYDDTEMCYFLFTDDADQFKPEENIDVNAKASYARKFTPGVLSTVVLPFAIGADVAEEAGTFYRVTSIENGYIHGKSEIPAPYVPYVFMPAKEYPFTNINIGQLPKVDEGKVNIDGAVFEFVTEETDLESGGAFDFYGFRNGEFVKAAFAKANPFRAYFKAPHSGNAPETLLWFDDSTTGITMLKANIESGKAEVYDLQGRRVMNPVRGLYIVNGKKAVVK